MKYKAVSHRKQAIVRMIKAILCGEIIDARLPRNRHLGAIATPVEQEPYEMWN